MNITLKELFCVEWEFDREIILDECHCFSVSAYIGDENGTEGFLIKICNEDFVKREIKEKGFFSGLWYLVTNDPSKKNIEKYFNDEIKKISGNNWQECYQKLRLIARSEFEDYIE